MEKIPKTRSFWQETERNITTNLIGYLSPCDSETRASQEADKVGRVSASSTAETFRHSNSFKGFQALPSNHKALDLAERFAQGGEAFGVIEGAQGWGKSHLLAAARAAKSQDSPRVASASALNFSSPSAHMAEAQVLIVDDLHLAEARPRVRQSLAFVLERRRRLGLPTLCAASNRCPAELGLKRSWTRVNLGEPSSEERAIVLQKLCANENIQLPVEFAALAANWVGGDGGTLRGLARHLRLSGLSFENAHPVKLAGLLFCRYGPTSEDLRDTILNAAAISAMKDQRRSRPYTLQQLAVYLMRNEAHLPEGIVAEYFGIQGSSVFEDQKLSERMLSRARRDSQGPVLRALDLLAEKICPK